MIGKQEAKNCGQNIQKKEVVLMQIIKKATSGLLAKWLQSFPKWFENAVFVGSRVQRDCKQ